MRKVLLRAHMSPFHNPDFMELSADNLIGKNIGNLIFAHSVCRAIMTEDTEVDAIKSNNVFTEEDAERINSEYDCFIIPLANAFRRSFTEELNHLSDLIEKLTIPCVVVGVGFQKPLEGGTIGGYPFDDDVKRFVNCVLEKSALLGLRGEQTAEYLHFLGFTPEKDFTVIGCPSMYLYGSELPYFEKKELTPDSAISVNCKINIDPRLHEFMERSLSLLHHYHYVPQILDEMNAMYVGKPLQEDVYKNIPDYYPDTFASPVYTGGHGIGFLNAPAWMEYLSQQDLSFGSRIHGNIAAIISGTPCYIIPSDARVEELACYHYIPNTPYNALPEGATIFDLYEKADYGPMFAHHRENFLHYKEFLKTNQVPNIFETSDCVKRGDCPFDKKMQEIDFAGPIRAFSDVSPEEQVERLRLYYQYLDEKKNDLRERMQGRIQNLKAARKEERAQLQEEIAQLRKESAQQKKDIARLEKVTKSQEEILNRRAVKMALRVADGFKKGE